MTNLSGANLNRREATGPKCEGRGSPSNFPRYPEYKDSGVEWLGEVPGHWEIIKVAHGFSNIGSGTTPPSNEQKWYEDGSIPWITTSELRENLIFETKKTLTDEALSVFTSLQVHPPGSLAIAMYGATIGRLGIFGVSATTNQACCVLSGSKSISPRFAFYWLLAFKDTIISLYATGGGQPNINQETIANLRLLAPSLADQAVITSFLNHETARIDALVEEQQRLIALLKEKRQAVISHAVTKGLDSDVPMKDSRLEWLGEVPEHWGVRGLTKLIGPVVDYRGRTPTKVDDGVFLITARNIRNGRIDYEISKEYVTPESVKSLLERGKPAIGDLLFTMEAPLGQVALIDRTDIALAQRIVKFRAVKGLMINTYLMYWLMSTGCQARMETLATGSTALGIKASKLGMIECPVPPVTEQIEIVNLIERENSKHDILLAEAQTNIDLLRERRSALISAAVTGKIDVRGWQPPASSAGATGEATQVEAV
ncbi:restriction endonuclease subunit S [Vreelandella venusta]|uniref:restriction endonuclease subunit S n=1 Tax=Vreelandella venusta TaxID=44935 RepID=UPI00384C6D21